MNYAGFKYLAKCRPVVRFRMYKNGEIEVAGKKTWIELHVYTYTIHD